MRTIHNILEADKARKEDGEAGFSLIELIIVVVILGILAAIAIPIFLGIQGQAKDNSVKAIAGNAAAAVAADLAKTTPLTTGAGAVPTGVYKATDSTVNVAIGGGGATLTLDNFCVTAAGTGSLAGAASATSGPGCSTATPAP